MNKCLFKLALVGIALTVGISINEANCGNDKGTGNGCTGIVGPTGPQGEQGAQGVQGERGQDAHYRPMPVVLETAIRLYDARILQVQAYNVFDMRNDRNDRVGLRLIFKLGSSYEERLAHKLLARIKQLEMLAAKYQEQLQ